MPSANVGDKATLNTPAGAHPNPSSGRGHGREGQIIHAVTPATPVVTSNAPVVVLAPPPPPAVTPVTNGDPAFRAFVNSLGYELKSMPFDERLQAFEMFMRDQIRSRKRRRESDVESSANS